MESEADLRQQLFRLALTIGPGPEMKAVEEKLEKLRDKAPAPKPKTNRRFVPHFPIYTLPMPKF